jgi:predicted PurR-regulated permease PerM
MPGPHVSFINPDSPAAGNSSRAAALQAADSVEIPALVVAVPEPVSWPLRQTVFATLITTAIVLLALLAVWHRQIALLLFGGIVLARALQPFIHWLEPRWQIGRVRAAIFVYATFLLLLSGAVVVVVPEVVGQTQAFAERMPTLYAQGRDFLQASPNRTLQGLGARIPEAMPDVWKLAKLGAGMNGGSSSPLSIIWQVGEGILGLIAVGVLAFYWSVTEEATIRSVLNLTPDYRRTFFQSVVDELLGKLGGYIRGQLILCAAVGVLSLIAYLLIGLPYPLMLALIAGLLEAVPIIGPTLGAVPAILVALSLGPQQTALVIGAAMLIQTLENYLLVPKIMDRSVGLGAVVTLFAIVACGALFGVVGAIFAIPLAAVSQTLFERLVLQADFKTQDFTASRDAAGVMHYQLQDLISDVKRQQRQKDSPVDSWTTESFAEIETLAVALDEIVREDLDDDAPLAAPLAKVTLS